MARGVVIGTGMTASTTPFGAFIRQRRIELGLSQKVVNQSIPRSGNTTLLISGIETGTRKRVAPDQAEALAKTLKLDVRQIRKFGVIRDPFESMVPVQKIIRQRREELGMSREEFARRMGVSVGTTYTRESTKSLTIRHHQAKKLAGVLQMDVSSFNSFLDRSHQKTTLSKLGASIRKAREARSLSILVLAEKVGVSKQYISLLELGRVPVRHDSPALQRIIDALELDRNQVISLVDPPKKLGRKRIHHPARIPACYLDTVRLGAFIRAKRRDAGLTQGELADKAKLSQTSISCIEGGVGKRAPHKGTIQALEAALGCTINLEDFVRK